MNSCIVCCFFLCFFLSTTLVSGEELTAHASTVEWNTAKAEEKIAEADALWLNGSSKQAIPLYEELLENLPKECEPFRATAIMRLAKSQLASGRKAKCLETLKLLDALEYTPEHHALTASELISIIETGKNPGHARTPVPLPPKAAVTIEVSLAGKFQTLSAALVEARKAKARGKTAEIILAPGIYPQSKTLVLGEKDSGLVIRSKDPKNPATITGGVNLQKWEEVTDPAAIKQLPEAVRDEVRVCKLTAHGIDSMGELVFGGFSSQRAAGGDFRFKTFPIAELFYNGQAQTMARWPNDKLVKLAVNSTPKKADARLARWAKEKDLWLYGYWYNDWADAYEKVANIDENGKISLAPPINCYGLRRKQGCAVNALCELDQPGEWHLDTAQNLIHYLPPENFDSKQCTLSSFGTVISAENCADLQIRHLKVEYVRGDALLFNNCSRLLVTGLDIQHCSGLGLKIQGGNQHLIHSCRINSMGRGGIDIQTGDWQQLSPAHSMIENCRISKLSRIDRTYTPALLLEGMGIKVRYNSFIDIPSSAIRIEACDSLIEMNYFNHCVYESGDQGAIDMWANPLYRGNIIRWNDFDRIISTGGHYGAAAVRLDDYISGFMITENIFRKGYTRGFGAVQINKGTDTYVEGNIFIDWHQSITAKCARGPGWKKGITSHTNSKRVLAETDWRSKAWQKKYPMVRDLFNGGDNYNYFVDNQRMGSGAWGRFGPSRSFSNRDGEKSFHGETLESIKPVLVPWHTIPVDLIGPYDVADGGR